MGRLFRERGVQRRRKGEGEERQEGLYGVDAEGR